MCINLESFLKLERNYLKLSKLKEVLNLKSLNWYLESFGTQKRKPGSKPEIDTPSPSKSAGRSSRSPYDLYRNASLLSALS